MGYLSVYPVREIVTIKGEKIASLRGRSRPFLQLVFLWAVTGWTEMGCEKQRLWTDCSPGLRAMWPFCVSTSVMAVFNYSKIFSTNGDLDRREREIHLMSFSKYFFKLQNLRMCMLRPDFVNDYMSGSDHKYNFLFLGFPCGFP